MRSDEPLLLVLRRHGVLDVFQVVVRGQVESIRCRYVVVDELVPVFDQTESFVRVVLLPCFDVDEVLFDVVRLSFELLLLLDFFA